MNIFAQFPNALQWNEVAPEIFDKSLTNFVQKIPVEEKLSLDVRS